MNDLFLYLHVVRQHVINQYIYIYIDGMYCKECQDPLYQILSYHAIYVLIAQCERFN